MLVQIAAIVYNLICLRRLGNVYFFNWFGNISLGKILRIDGSSKF